MTEFKIGENIRPKNQKHYEGLWGTITRIDEDGDPIFKIKDDPKFPEFIGRTILFPAAEVEYID